MVEEGHYTGRQAEFEMGELFHKKPLRTDHRLYTKGVAGERQVEQGKDSELPRSSSKQGNNKAIMEEEKEVGRRATPQIESEMRELSDKLSNS